MGTATLSPRDGFVGEEGPLFSGDSWSLKSPVDSEIILFLGWRGDAVKTDSMKTFSFSISREQGWQGDFGLKMKLAEMHFNYISRFGH